MRRMEVTGSREMVWECVDQQSMGVLGCELAVCDDDDEGEDDEDGD